jgi:predicted metal-dependent hydrolase
MTQTPVPRLVPDEPLPPYTFVPGQSPHPVSDPGGHSYGVRHAAPPPLDPADWQTSRAYLRGIDLFNHGFYWEAHEVWEGLWNACGRVGTVGDFLKGLIQMTAAGVKVRQDMPRGVHSLSQGAAELFEKVLADLGPASPRFLGLDVGALLCFVREVAASPERVPPAEGGIVRVFPLVLRPDGSSS